VSEAIIKKLHQGKICQMSEIQNLRIRFAYIYTRYNPDGGGGRGLESVLKTDEVGK